MIDMQKLHMEMQAKRQQGEDVTLQGHLAKHYAAIGNTDKLYAELDINPNVMKVSALLDRDDNANYLFPEIVRDAVRNGMVADPIYPNLVMASETISQPTQTMPHLDMSKAKPSKTTAGATVQKGSVSWGKKTVEISTYARGLELPYEAIQYCSISLMSTFFQDLGMLLAALISRNAVEVLVSGDQANGSEAAAVIGVEDTDKVLQYRDLVRVWTRMALMGMTPGSMVATEELSNHVLDMDEFKKREAGTTTATIKLQRPLPKDQNLFPQVAVPSGQLIEVDTSRAMVQLSSQALMVETDKIIARRIQESVASVTTGFAIAKRAARIVIDTTKAWADNPFPAWFAPQE